MRDGLASKIIDYLLVDAWDIENSAALQSLLMDHLFHRYYIHDNVWTSEGIDQLFQLFRRMSAVGQAIEANLIHDIIRISTSKIVGPPAELNYNDNIEFPINEGADIECRDSFRKETAFLVVAEVDKVMSLKLMPILLRFGADYSAVDYKGRGPLHLALKPSRQYRYMGGGPLRSRTLKDKLVYLLQAGCSAHAVDNYGRTPTYVARKWRRTKAWEAALRKAGKLECGRSECQCEITVRLPQALCLSE